MFEIGFLTCLVLNFLINSVHQIKLIASRHTRNFIYHFILHVTTSNVPAQCVKTTENRKCYGLWWFSLLHGIDAT